jgi:hypothetical protein
VVVTVVFGVVVTVLCGVVCSFAADVLDFVAACTAEAVVCGFAGVLEVCCVVSSGISAVSG